MCERRNSFGALGRRLFYLELQHHPESTDQKKINDGLLKISKELNIPAVVTTDLHYIKKEDSEAQDVLLAIQTGTDIGNKDRLTMKEMELYFKSPEEIAGDFPDNPELFENIKKIVEQCNLELDLGEIILPHFTAPNKEDSFQYLKRLSLRNFKKIYSLKNKEAKDRFDYELDVIKKTGFADYFLIIEDFIRFTKEKA